MIILGFSYWSGSHDSSAAIVRDGELIAAAEEERFTRNKHDGGVPLNAIDYCLREAGVSLTDVDLLAYPDHPFRTGPNSQLVEMQRRTLESLVKTGRVRRRSLLHRNAIDALGRIGMHRDAGLNGMVSGGFNRLREMYGSLPPVRYYGHHMAHAAAAYLTSGFTESAVLTLDGRGGPLSGATWSARGEDIHVVDEEPYTNSLGWFYRDCTRYAGLGQFGEGKLMGLAPYGNAQSFADVVAKLIDTTGERWFNYLRPPGEDEVGFTPRTDEDIMSRPYADFGAAVQHALESGMERAARSVLGATGAKNLCVGGGVALNCSTNGKLLASGIADDMWLFPASGDAGLSVGAALLASRDAGELKHRRLDSPYWGPVFDEREIESALCGETRVRYTRPANLYDDVATMLANGDVVGWFQGRMELGPRALGNRSILADPRSTEMRDKVNRVKRREPWRPLAPSVMAERAADWFELVPPNSFMLFATQTRPIARERAPAVVHVDGTARPQPVSKNLNAPFYDLIAAFERLTGVPILLNTSFNDAGEPIVCTPTDALRTFLATDLDVLAIGPFVVRKLG